jgi:2-dehydro-3-deoxygluconokinase
MRAAWRREGVADDLAFTVPARRPGLYLIELDDRGERRFHYWRSESAARLWLQQLEQAGGAARLTGAELVYLSGISLAILTAAERLRAFDLLRALRGKVGLIAFDPNYRAALWGDAEAARRATATAAGLADIFLPSREDMQTLFGCDSGEEMALIRGFGCGEAAMTADVGECLILAGDEQSVRGAAATAVVDSSGAGDSFNGAYLAARLEGKPPAAAALAGLALAAKVVGQAGAVISH